MLASNPRSMIASTVRPAHSAGTVPRTVIQLVDHGAPQRPRRRNGARGAASPSATGTGSPGAAQIPASSGRGPGRRPA